MDNQIALMKRYQKDENIIAYVHTDKIVLIKREFIDETEVRLFEITVDIETGCEIDKRLILPHEMTLEDFQRLKWVLTESTRAEFNREWLVTYRNVSFELLEKTHVVSLSSVEEAYMSKLTMELEACNMTARTMTNALRIIKQANLTKTQRQRYLKYKYLNHSTRDIAREEGVDQKSVWESIATAEKKISKQLSKIKEL